MKRIALVLAFLFLAAPSWGAEKSAWQGPGLAPCEEFNNACRKHPEDENLFFSWALGFMSGLNTDLLEHGETDLHGLSEAAQKESIRDFCKDHPQARYLEAVFKLYNRMRHDQGLPSYYKIWREPPKKAAQP